MEPNKQKLIFGILFAATIGMSCNVPKRSVFKKPQAIPSEFAGTTAGTVESTPLSRDAFFKDVKLRTLVADVLKNNPDMNIALQRVQVSAAWFRQSKGGLLPSLHGVAAVSGTKYGKHTMEGVGNFDTNLSPNIDDDQKIDTDPTPDFLLGLSSSWEIDIWGKLRKLKKAARLRYIASQEAANWVTSLLVTQTATLYYELVALDKEAVIIKQNIDLQKRALEIVEAHKASGRATELAVQQFKAQLLNTQIAEYAIKQRVVEIQNNLNQLAGKYDGPIDRSASIALNDHFAEEVKTGIPATMLMQRPDVREANVELEATKANVDAARAAFFPAVNISAYTMFNSFKGNLLFSGTSLGYQLLGGLTAPIFQQNQLKSHFRIATANQLQAYYNYEKTALNAYREVINSMSALENIDKMLLIKKDEVAALETSVEISHNLYIAGYASYLEIVTAQKNKLDAELEQVKLQRNNIFAVLDLYKSVGGGWD